MGQTKDRYYAYYLRQAGGEIGPIYRASYGVQKGRGIGSFLAGLWRLAKPLVYSGLKSVGREALSSASKIVTDIGTKPVKEIVRTRLTEAGENLRTKAEQKVKAMSGSGLRLTKRPRLKASANKIGRHSVRKRRRNRFVERDIFST